MLKFLPKAASAVCVTFQNPPFSPGSRDKRPDNYTGKCKAYASKGYSGPIVSIIPDEARGNSKSESTFETQEPTSPKVSCIGKIKRKKSIKIAKRVSPPKGLNLKPVSDQSSSPRQVKKPASKLRPIFGLAKPARKSDATSNKPELADKAPSLGQMKRFASGRDAFAFDWMAQIASLEADHRDYYSDDERRNSDFEEEEEEEEEAIIPFSTPMTVGGGGLPLQPRKEINIWKRRTMNPPRPLQVKAT